MTSSRSVGVITWRNHDSGVMLKILQEAQKMVDFILRHGNDLLAVECLRGYEVCGRGGGGGACVSMLTLGRST